MSVPIENPGLSRHSALLVELRERIFRWLAYKCRVPEEAAEDLANDTILVLISRPDYTGKDETEVAKISFGIARNKWREYLRQARRIALPIDPVAPSPTVDRGGRSPEDAMAKVLTVQGILSSLDRTCRVVLMMKWVGSSTEEIREKAGLSSANAVYIRYFRCFAEFMRLWKARPGEES